MSSSTPYATLDSAPDAPAPILVIGESRRGRTPTADRSDRRTVSTRIAVAWRTWARWLPMAVTSTPSAQAMSTLTPGDRLSERR